jgi:phytoene dehydrogenase-like protein
VLLESAGRVGGRVRSERRRPYFLNWGGHVYAGGNSSTAWLLNNTGVDSVAVPGSLAGLATPSRGESMSAHLSGVLTALATPFASDGQIDEHTLRRLVDRSIDGG